MYRYIFGDIQVGSSQEKNGILEAVLDESSTKELFTKV